MAPLVGSPVQKISGATDEIVKVIGRTLEPSAPRGEGLSPPHL